MSFAVIKWNARDLNAPLAFSQENLKTNLNTWTRTFPKDKFCCLNFFQEPSPLKVSCFLKLSPPSSKFPVSPYYKTYCVKISYSTEGFFASQVTQGPSTHAQGKVLKKVLLRDCPWAESTPFYAPHEKKPKWKWWFTLWSCVFLLLHGWTVQPSAMPHSILWWKHGLRALKNPMMLGIDRAGKSLQHFNLLGFRFLAYTYNIFTIRSSFSGVAIGLEAKFRFSHTGLKWRELFSCLKWDVNYSTNWNQTN